MTASPVFAHNCGSLSDCFSSLAAALAVIAAVAAIGALILLTLPYLGPGMGLGMVLGAGGAVTIGGAMAVPAGAVILSEIAVITAAGAAASATVSMATANDGRGSGTSGNQGGGRGGGGKQTSPNQLQQQVQRGDAPRSVDRVDNGRQLPNGRWEEPHVHFRDGSALYRDGVWRHGGRPLTNREIEWIVRNGWSLPGG